MAQANFSSPKELGLIEYPGMVVNVPKMVNTLGGITKISQVLDGEHKRLDLRFHPENPFNKATTGDSGPCAGLLLSVRVRRSKYKSTKAPHVQVKFLGHCVKSITFDSLCDFQYLPLYKSPTQNTNELISALSLVLPQSVTDTDYLNRNDVPVICLPQLFARSDNVHTGIFRSETQEDGQHEVLGVLQKSTLENRDIVNFNMIDNFPVRPDTQIIKRMKVKYVSDEQLERVKKLFDECPIWTRIALLFESGVSQDKLKCIIPSLAYYFTTGPWRTLYVRYGYDPRKNFNSRYYQTFDFRLRFRSGVAEFVANRKDRKKKNHKEHFLANTLVQDLNYPYLEENKLPRSRQCMLRYLDIRMSKIQEMLEKLPSPLTGATCNEKTGWLPTGFDAQVRQIVSNSIKDLLHNHYRKDHIEAELDFVENTEQEGEEDDSDGNDSLSENLEGLLEGMQSENDQ